MGLLSDVVLSLPHIKSPILVLLQASVNAIISFHYLVYYQIQQPSLLIPQTNYFFHY